MSLQKTLALIGIGALIMGFQNCSKMGFSTGNGGTTMQSLVPIDGSNNTQGVGTGTTSNSDSNVGMGTPSDSQPSYTPPSPPTNNGGSCENGHNSGDNTHSGSDDSGDYVACILDQHGKSLKLGLLTSDLAGVNSVAESVCVTVHECLGPVAKYFQVLGAYERGYCDHNPNVQRLTDAQVDAILAQMQPNNAQNP